MLGYVILTPQLLSDIETAGLADRFNYLDQNVACTIDAQAQGFCYGRGAAVFGFNPLGGADERQTIPLEPANTISARRPVHRLYP